jgi:hypothetical protein
MPITVESFEKYLLEFRHNPKPALARKLLEFSLTEYLFVGGYNMRRFFAAIAGDTTEASMKLVERMFAEVVSRKGSCYEEAIPLSEIVFSLIETTAVDRMNMSLLYERLQMEDDVRVVVAIMQVAFARFRVMGLQKCMDRLSESAPISKLCHRFNPDHAADLFVACRQFDSPPFSEMVMQMAKTGTPFGIALSWEYAGDMKKEGK